MDPSNNNSFGSFSYGGRAGVGTPVQQDMFLAPATPEKKSKKGIILIALLVVLVCLGGGLLLLMNNNSSSETTATEALDRLKKAANYAYYCSEEMSVDLAIMRSSESCLADRVGQVSIFTVNDGGKDSVLESDESFFNETILLFESYADKSKRFYSDNEENSGYFLRLGDAFILDSLRFLKTYTLNTPIITDSDFDLSEEEYLDKFSNLASLESNISEEYLSMQRDFYRDTVELLGIYKSRGCVSDMYFTNECVAGVELDEEEALLLNNQKKIYRDIENYGNLLVVRFFNRCIGNESFYIQEKEGAESD